MASVALVVFVVEVAGVGSVRGVVVEEEMAEADGGEAGFGELRKNGGGVVDVGAESEGIEKLDIVVVSEGGHGVRSDAGGVEAGFGNESGDDASATGGEDAEKGIFRGGEFFGLDTKAARGASFEFFAGEFLGFATGRGAFGEADFAGGALAAGGNGMRNRGGETGGTGRSPAG